MHRVGQLGDLVCTIPVLNALRSSYPSSWIGLLVSPVKPEYGEVLELFRQATYLDQVIVYYGRDLRSPTAILQWVRQLRALQASVFVELSPADAPVCRILRDLILGRLIGARRIVGLGAVVNRLRTKEGSVAGGEAVRLLSLLEEDGLLPPSQPVRFPLPVEDAGHRADRLLSGSYGSAAVALNPGAKRQTNRWPADRFAAVGRAIARRGVTVVLTGSPSERELCCRVRGLMGGDAIVAAGEGGILFTAALLQRCAALVTNDTGTMHLAAAVGTPAVVAGTARDLPGRWQPWGRGHRLIRKEVPCSPCYREVCDHLTCLHEISVTEVLEALEEVLDAWRQGRGAEVSGAEMSGGCL